MRPVFQTIFDPDKGDCLRASIASIFERDLESVPNFMAMDGGSDKVSIHMNRWLQRYGGLTELRIPFISENYSCIRWCTEGVKGGVYALGTVPSQMYANRDHAIVVYISEVRPESDPCRDPWIYIAHDPNPKNTAYGWNDLKDINFFVKTWSRYDERAI